MFGFFGYCFVVVVTVVVVAGVCVHACMHLCVCVCDVTCLSNLATPSSLSPPFLHLIQTNNKTSGDVMHRSIFTVYSKLFCTHHNIVLFFQSFL